ncbi:MAG: sigma-70 family RNA polymerase sigma factor [Ruminococcaceae bacterium]|nr:sigma-70 family RNA polymerase sigma factor [Oscillospiraceae bacterium]
MNELEITFSSWKQTLAQLAPGSELDAVQFLTLMEPEGEEEVENALSLLDEKDILLNIDSLDFFAPSADGAVRLKLEKELVTKNALISGLAENDPLRLYLEELAGLPACGDPELLAREYAAGNEDVLPQLTNLMLSRVAERSFALAGRGVLLVDLLQEGSLGLWQAILAYEDGGFEAYCDRCIQRSLHKALTLQARAYGVGQKLRQAMEDYRSADEKLLSELGRNPTAEEMAEALHMSVGETAAVAEMLETTRRLQQAKQEPEPEEEEQEENQSVENTAYFQMRQRISELLSVLDETDAKLLSLRYGLEAGLPKSAAEVGQILGLTSEEVTARETAALQKLRKEG